jgi:hypothetical protein
VQKNFSRHARILRCKHCPARCVHINSSKSRVVQVAPCNFMNFMYCGYTPTSMNQKSEGNRHLSRLLCWPRWRTVTKNIIGQMVVDAVSEINVALAFKTSECSELGRMLAQSLVQMDDIFAANENIFSACHKMHRNVDLIKPRKVIGRCRGLVHSYILSDRSIIKATELSEGGQSDKTKIDHQNFQNKNFVGHRCRFMPTQDDKPVLTCNFAKIV